jgi:hypothetical protein
MIGILICLKYAAGCILAQNSPGICVKSDSININFCGDELEETVCIPDVQDFWSDWNASSKDAALSLLFISTLESKLHEETSTDLSPVFTRNKKCLTAFKRLICLTNFPGCSDSVAYPVCDELCQSYENECKILNNTFCSIFPASLSNTTECSNCSYMSYVLLLILALLFSLVFIESKYLSSISVALQGIEAGVFSAAREKVALGLNDAK